MAVPVSYYFFDNTIPLRAIPFKSTWEGGECHFFYFSVGCGGETIFLYVGWGGLLKINSVGGGGGIQ